MGMEFIKDQFRFDTASVVAAVSNRSIDSEYYFKISSNGNEDTYFALTERAFCMLLDAMKFIDSKSSFGKHIPLKVEEEIFGADLRQRFHEQSNKVAQLIKERDELLFQMKYISNQTHLGHIQDTINSCLCRLGEVK